MSTDFSDSMDVTTWGKCCNVTIVTSSTFIHDHIIIDFKTVTGSQGKEDADKLLVKAVDNIISNEVGNVVVRKFIYHFYCKA